MAISTGMSDSDGGYGGGYGDNDGGYSDGGFGGNYGGNTDSLGGNLGIGPDTLGGGNVGSGWTDNVMDIPGMGLSTMFSQDYGPSFSTDTISNDFTPGQPMSANAAGIPEQDFWDSGWGKFVKSLGRFAAATNPVGRLGLMGYDAYSAAQKGNYGQALGSVVGNVTGNGLLGSAVGIGTDAALGKNVSSRVGGTLGSVVGGGIAGPVGAMVGGYVGSQAGRAGGVGSTDTSGFRGDAGRGGGLNFENLASGLGNLYLNNRAAKAADSNVQSLGSMFGPNSAYSQQMRQQLERRDAASGRRSQYGPREVELQAKLAQMAAQYGPNIAQSNMAAQQLSQQRRAQNLSSLYAMGRESGLFGQAQDALSGLFSSNQAPPLYFDSNTSGDVYSL